MGTGWDEALSPIYPYAGYVRRKPALEERGNSSFSCWPDAEPPLYLFVYFVDVWARLAKIPKLLAVLRELHCMACRPVVVR